jgi:hypothetical protein
MAYWEPSNALLFSSEGHYVVLVPYLPVLTVTTTLYKHGAIINVWRRCKWTTTTLLSTSAVLTGT